MLNEVIKLGNEKYGIEKFDHPHRVSMRVFDWYFYEGLKYKPKCVEFLISSYLHDIIEDTDCSFEELKESIKMLTSPEINRIVESIELLTHDKDIPYDEYIDNIINSDSIIAKIVKKCDMEENMNRNRIGLTEEKIKKLNDKYSINYPKFEGII